MMEKKCPGCGEHCIFITKPVYDGFDKVGESSTCAACGFEISSGSAPEVKTDPLAGLFSDADKPEKVEVFSEEDRPNFCHRCSHYVVNPFTQRCDLHQKEVSATDSCGDFVEEDEGESEV